LRKNHLKGDVEVFILPGFRSGEKMLCVGQDDTGGRFVTCWKNSLSFTRPAVKSAIFFTRNPRRLTISMRLL